MAKACTANMSIFAARLRIVFRAQRHVLVVCVCVYVCVCVWILARFISGSMCVFPSGCYGVHGPQANLRRHLFRLLYMYFKYVCMCLFVNCSLCMCAPVLFV